MPPENITLAVKPARTKKFNWRDLLINGAIPIIGMIVALFIGGLMLLLLGANPLQAYAALVNGAVGSLYSLTMSLVKATPLLLVGLGICIAFRASVINIGAEGQIIAGALMATWFPLAFRAWPGWILVPVTLVLGFLAGAAWGLIPGILKARLRVNEILSTVMMNAIAVQLMNLLIRGPLIDPAGVTAGTYLAQSERLPENAWLPRLIPQTQLHFGAIIAVLLAVWYISSCGAPPSATAFARWASTPMPRAMPASTCPFTRRFR